MKGYQEFLFVGILIQLRAQQDEERKELSELRNEIKSQLQLDKDVSPSTVFSTTSLNLNTPDYTR